MRLPDEATLSALFDSTTMARAREYVRVGRVLRAEVAEDGLVWGRVRGTRPQPYEQEITLRERKGHTVIDGWCTCPIETNCKHVAAVLLELARRQPTLLELPPPPSIALDPPVAGWLKDLSRAVAPASEYPPEIVQRLFYVLTERPIGGAQRVVVDLLSVRKLKNGGYGKPSRFKLSSIQNDNLPKYILPVDARLVRSLAKNLGQAYYPDATFRLEGSEASRLLREMLATGRCVWGDVSSDPLELGEPRPAKAHWVDLPDGSQKFQIAAPRVIVLPTTPAWYVDREEGTCGPIDLGIDDSVLEVLQRAPTVRAENAQRVHDEIAQLLPDRPELRPAARNAPILRQVEPIPYLTLHRDKATFHPYRYSWNRTSEPEGTEHVLPTATLEFDYDGVRVGGTGAEVRKTEGEDVIVMPRRRSEESEALREMHFRGWMRVREAYEWKVPGRQDEDFLIAPPSPTDLDVHWQAFYEFLRQDVPDLREAGWRIEGAPEVPPDSEVIWQVEAREETNDWFGLDLGIVVQGEKIDLRPILIEALRTLARAPAVDEENDVNVYHELPNGKLIALPAKRLRPLMNALRELFGSPHEWPDELGIPAARAAETALLDGAGVKWEAPERLQSLRGRLQDFERIEPVPVPASLQAELRPYQASGFAWLQFLREFGFGGILADDMGLGKTVQTLAHVLQEKEAGRLDRPVLIVAPTSTLPNWRREAERFAPSLRVLVLHGPERKTHFAEMGEHDLVITSFPLLVRDREALKAQEFHLAVLDEAQNIKNPAAAVTQAARSLNARHRLCLTGTPVENSLTELWSLFHFLMPGFLGSLADFGRRFRTPIESKGDTVAQGRLVRRIRPFVMRRTKEEVATELPPKTEMVERVELAGAQRDLYESLRLAMDRRVRELIASKGFEKSRIEILDALLKLRQVCCDPRLVKLDSAKKVQGSAKRERLLEMLGQLRGEGRRILLFSQFTSMLDLIEEDLRTAGMEWVRISGDTQDRDTPVRRFQAGEVPLFLISLRAGGTGLNLTAADTVIHYDPWWNPAVENQATDRAYRIGQDKAVFVFKLVAAGTVEERILELQERKARLAGAVFGDGEAATSLTADDLRWVLSHDEG
jgi:hypothetical protein